MSSVISPRVNNNATKDNSAQDEWVEIVEPKSKTKIYANLATGVCAKEPPDGVNVLTTDDFSDHWWELYDKKTGRFYYYNPDQQKTVWTKPTTNVNGNLKKVLIIPVSKLRTFRKLSPDGHQVEKCDASTQTIASHMTSTGTQTVSQTALEDLLNNQLNLVGSEVDALNSNSSAYTRDFSQTKSLINSRQHSGPSGRHCNPYLKNYQRQLNAAGQQQHAIKDQPDNVRSSQYSPKNATQDAYQEQGGSDIDSYFGPPSAHQKNRNSMQIQPPLSNYAFDRRSESKSTSTFRTTKSPVDFQMRESNVAEKDVIPKDKSSPLGQSHRQMVTNKLSHYLVREARTMGIALISDDEIEDDDQDSDDDGNLDDDEDTDLRDDLSSNRDLAQDLNASQDLGEDSSEGWKSLSDQESPNGQPSGLTTSDSSRRQDLQRSPFLSETAGSSFTHDESTDDQSNSAANKGQQLDHRKLVENFKKSRQTSALGFNDSLRRSYRLDANHAVQKIKTVADSYFNHGERDKSCEKYLRQLSTLSTLPRHNRETKEKVALRNQEELNGEIVDADYDVVEENCGYYSDSERLQANLPIPKADLTSATKQASSPASYFDRNKSTRGSTFSVESFARENLTRHPKGGLLFNRKVKWSRMISWTRSAIKQPMISSVSSDLTSDSVASFKLIQQFMGDRKVVIGKKYRQILLQSGIGEELVGNRKSLERTSSPNVGSNVSSSAPGSSPNVHHLPDRLRDELAYELATRGCVKTPLRDEIFVQLARQLTENPNQESVTWGLTLMSIMLSYFSPSSKFAPFLLAFLQSHSHAMASDVCLPRLEKRLRQNWLTYCRKPADGKEISIVRLSITKWPQYCGVFGESLERIMDLQSCSPYLKTLRLPWILTTLGAKLIDTGGCETEGIFRCAADHDLLAQLRLEIDCVDFRKITDDKQVKSLLMNVQDPHVIAGLLKLFFRQLHEPVFPSRLYDVCLSSCQDDLMVCRLFNQSLPNVSKDVVAYLIRLLQHLSRSEIVERTKMDASNLSMVWAPNLLRAPELDQTISGCSENQGGSKWSIANGDEQTASTTIAAAPSQSMIFEQTRQEMQFIKALITHLDTSFIKHVT